MKHLLLLHGALGTARQMQPLATFLSDSFAIHTLTFYGHGGELPPEEGYNFDRFADDIINYLDKEGLAEVSVFGYSMGGYAALYTALKHADRFSRIATLGTKVIWTTAGAEREVKMLNPEAIEQKVPAFAAHLEQLHGDQWKQVLSATAAMMRQLGSEPLLNEKDYRALTHQIMLGIGDRDHMAGLEDAVEVFKYLQNGRLWVLPQTPHPLEKVDIKLLAAGLKRFFQD